MPPPLAFSRLQLAAALIEYDNDPDDPYGPKRNAEDSAILAHFLRDQISPQKSDPRRSVASFKNPFGIDNQSETGYNDEGDEELEVDLQSWGLDAFVPKDKIKPLKQKAKESTVNSTRLRLSSGGHELSTITPRRAMITSKSASLGGLPELQHATSMTYKRHRSLSLPLELAPIPPVISPTSRTEGTVALEAQYMMSPTQSVVPFPILGQARRPSAASVDFDSNRLTSLERMNSAGENPFAIDRPSRISRFDPKAAEWKSSLSSASKGAKETDKLLPVNEGPSNKYHRYSTLDLLRPKVLVMPSPLQATLPDDVEPEPVRQVRDGFELSTDGPPLPPGAKSSQRLSSFSALGSISHLPSSETFTSNPLLDLSLSQRTFRNTLAMHGKISDFDSDLPHATHDGQMAQLVPLVEGEGLPTNPNEIPSSGARPAGKLYGKSLIDDLEARKAELRSKQRVFKGDERPAMMARHVRPTTLIDPASLTDQSIAKHVDASRNARQSLLPSPSRKPLLDFNHGQSKLDKPPATHLRETRSVFGVDALWQYEMEKLGEIQLQEAREQEETPKESSKGKRRRKVIPKVEAPVEQLDTHAPQLPYINAATAVERPPSPEDANDLSADEEPVALTFTDHANYSWHVDSSDEEGHQPLRRRVDATRHPSGAHTQNLPGHGADSDEDLPLATVRNKGNRVMHDSDDEDKPLAQVFRQGNVQASPRANMTADARTESGSDEDQPLALRASRIPHLRQNAEDEDNVPLALHPQQQRKTQYQMLAHLQGQMMVQSQMQNNMLMSAHAPMLDNFYGLTMTNPMVTRPMNFPLPIPSPPPDEVNYGKVDSWRRKVVVDGNI